MVQIDFPFRFDARGRTAGADEDGHIRDMIEQLIFTEAGERVNRPEFGGGLRGLVFAPNSPELAAALQLGLRAALGRWLGDVIDVQALTVTSEDAALLVRIAYVVRRTGEPRVALFRGGAP